MKRFWSRWLHSPDRRKLAENFLSLYVVQGTNYLLSLVTLPYLGRVLEADTFGLVMFAQAVIQHFIIVTDFGFNLSATRAISLARDDRAAVGRIYSAVMTVKLGLMIVSFAALLLLIATVDKFAADPWLYILTFGMVAGNVLFPIWFFQGMERMKYITVLNTVAKFIFAGSIFILVRDPRDYLLVPLLNSLGFITAGLLAVGMVLRRFRVPVRVPSPADLREQLRQGWYIFISQVSISLYTSTNTLILGFLASNTVVGYYTAAEKIIQAVKFAPSPFFHAIYPHSAQLADRDPAAAKRFLARIARFTALGAALAFAVMFGFAEPIVVLLLGESFRPAVDIYRIFAVLIAATPMAYLIFNVSLLSFKLDKHFSRIYLSGAVINFALLGVFVLGFSSDAIGIALASVLTQLIITAMGYRVLHRHDIRLFARAGGAA